MSANNPIPVRLRDEFVAHMDANNDESAPDGAWFQRLVDAAEEFFIQKRLQHGDPHSATHQYIRLKQAAEGAKA
jgi:hypothetical protein